MWRVVLILALMVLTGCGPPPEAVGDQVPVASEHFAPAYLIAEFGHASDAQAWVNQHWPRYHLYQVQGNGFTASMTYVLCHIEKGACQPPTYFSDW